MAENLFGARGTNYSNAVYGNAIQSALGTGANNNAYGTRWDNRGIGADDYIGRGDNAGAAYLDPSRDTLPALNGSTNNWWGDALGYGKVGLGIGQLGLGLAGYFEDKKTAKTQRDLMEQQRDTNKWLLDQQKSRQANFSKSFGAPATPARI